MSKGLAKVGRPSKYKKNLADELLDILEKGLTKAEAACKLKISRDTLYRWAKEHDEFGEALKVGTEWSEAENIEILRAGDLGQIPKFNPTAYALYMNNTFGWSKGEQAGTNINIQNMNVLQALPTEEINKKLQAYLAKYEAVNLDELKTKLVEHEP